MIPVVALPGVLLGESSWSRFGVLTRRVAGRVFYPHTFPGFDGRRRFQQETPSPADYAEDLRKRLDAYALERAHFVAHCSGCLPAVEFARRYPDRVASLTLIAYWYGSKEWESRAVIRHTGVDTYARARAESLVFNPEHRDRIVPMIVDAVTDPEGMLAMARSISDFYNKDVYDCPVPLHFVIGAEDVVTSPAAQLHVARKAGGIVTMVSNAGHCPHIEQPDAVFGPTAQFWKAHDGAR